MQKGSKVTIAGCCAGTGQGFTAENVVQLIGVTVPVAGQNKVAFRILGDDVRKGLDIVCECLPERASLFRIDRSIYSKDVDCECLIMVCGNSKGAMQDMRLEFGVLERYGG